MAVDVPITYPHPVYRFVEEVRKALPPIIRRDDMYRSLWLSYNPLTNTENGLASYFAYYSWEDNRIVFASDRYPWVEHTANNYARVKSAGTKNQIRAQFVVHIINHELFHRFSADEGLVDAVAWDVTYDTNGTLAKLYGKKWVSKYATIRNGKNNRLFYPDCVRRVRVMSSRATRTPWTSPASKRWRVTTLMSGKRKVC